MSQSQGVRGTLSSPGPRADPRSAAGSEPNSSSRSRRSWFWRVQEGPLRPLAVYGKAALTGARAARSFFGTRPLTCNVCLYAGGFLAFGEPLRFDARCPRCGALERHRLLAVWLEQHADAVRGRRVLHIAPEPPVARLLRPLAASYTTGDLNPRKADRVLNVEALDLSTESVDVVVCNHVLEHVDDRRALAEIRRVLRPGGLAVLSMPVIEGWAATYENGWVSGKAERRRHFGQHDHVRFYGRDVRQRIADAGFALEEFTAVEPLVTTLGLLRGETLFLARRPT